MVPLMHPRGGLTLKEDRDKDSVLMSTRVRVRSRKLTDIEGSSISHLRRPRSLRSAQIDFQVVASPNQIAMTS